MKKFTLIAMMLFIVTAGFAQASLYSFAQSTGTYSPITGGTVLATCTSCTDSYDSSSFVITLPTPFTFNGTSVSSVVMRTDGSLVLGSTTTGTSTGPIAATTTATGIASALGMDLRTSTITGTVFELRWEDTGSEYVFQWQNAARWSQGNAEKLNFQIRIVKATGVISFVYGEMSGVADSTTYQPQVGLRGASNADYNNRRVTTTVPDDSPSWEDTAAGTSNSHTVRFTSGTPAAFPANGLTYTYSPPPPCTGTPVAGTVSGSLSRFVCNGSTPAAIAVTGVSAAVPGISYQWEQSLNGTDWTNATGGTGATTTSYTPPVFNGTTIQYRFKVTCAGSSESAVTSAVSINNESSSVSQATALAVTADSATPTSFGVSWTNGTGNRRIVVISDAAITDPVNQTGAAAITANNVYAGTGQQIVYEGTGSSATILGLNCNTSYNVKVFEYNRCGSGPYDFIFSPVSETNAITFTTPSPATAAALPVTNNFTGFTGANLPAAVAGWYEGAIPTAAATTPGTSYPGGNASNWVNSSVLGGTTARVNLYTNTRNEWIISPKIQLTANSRLKFKAAITNWNSAAADATGMQGTDDKVRVMVSTDGCGVNWTPVFTFDAANTTTLTNVLTDFEVLLTAYNGQTIQIAFQAIDGPTDDTSDYDFHIGDIVVEEVPACDIPVLAESTNIDKDSVTINWAAPSTGTPTGYEYVVSATNATPAGAGTAVTGLTANVSGLSASTDYYVFVRSVCGAGVYSDWTVAGEFTTLCDYPEILTTTPDEVCGIGTASLSATATGGTIKWYAAANGGASLATGANFTTPEISETSTYYVVAEGVGTSVSGGLIAPNASWTGFASEDWGIVFNANTDVTVNSVDVYSTTAGTLDVMVVNAAGEELFSTGSLPVAAGGTTTPTTIPLNISVTQGNGYKILVKSYTGVSLIRGSVSGFPYVNDNISVTASEWGGTTTGTYYFFYNIQTTGVCAGARTPVTVTVTDAPEIEVTATEEAICIGESTQISVTSANTDYTYVWTPGDLTGAAQTVTPAETTTYTVTATDAVSGCVAREEITITVNMLPFAEAVQSDVAICEGSIGQLSVVGGPVSGDAVMGTGTTAPSTTSYPNPFSAYYGGAKTQILFRSSELEAQGLVEGTEISSLSFDFFASVANTANDLTIRIGTTDSDQLTAGFDSTANLVTVYNANFTPVAGTTGLVPFNFSTPFIWNGDNIIVEVVHNQGNNGNGSGTRTRTTTTSFNSVYYGAVDGVTPAGAASIDSLDEDDFDTDGTSTSRPNIVFNHELNTTVVWSPAAGLFTDAGATTPYNGENVSTVYVMTAAAATYTATITSEAGCTSDVTINVTITDTPAPTVADAAQTLCAGATLEDITITGTDILWYAAATGGESLEDDTELTDATVYYASQTADGCESNERTAVTVTISTVATPVVAITQPGCGDTTGSVTVTAPVGAEYTYSINGTDYQASATFDGLAEGIHTVYVKNEDGCTSILDVTIEAAPVVPVAPEVTATQPGCGDTTGSVTVTAPVGAEYTYSINGTDFQASATFDNLAAGTYTVTVMNTSGCTSTLDVTINAAPATPATPVVDVIQPTCAVAGTITVTAPVGAEYTYSINGTDFQASAVFADVAPGTYTITVKNDAGCTAALTDVVVNDTPVVAAPVADANQSFCNGATVEELEAEGEDILWYADETGGEPLADDTVLVDGTTYYASQTIECESEGRTAVTVMVTTVAAPTGEAVQVITVNNAADATLENLVVDAEEGAVITWYASEEDAANGDNPLALTTQLEDGVTYYATQTVGDCTSVATLAVTANVVLGTTGFDKDTFSYYPNPVKDVLNITSASEITSVSVFNMLGQQVMAVQPGVVNALLDMSVLSDGTYLINVTAGNSVKTIKVVKKQ
ncbi:T9SS type A sorting domain-containing protein [Flavobacterium sp. D11R37]|uniref:Ig-like domain-containing protein n=1 Tax=Flavobacterium coralii TaxID=2838017 RepID=UPI001CA62DC5|nr:T9SS type A sorting domain-containing protein [Flavobacterium coralii]MBY8961241.1 T9SS type A sorting domain-containing protein [Flavobacterium coralii]